MKLAVREIAYILGMSRGNIYHHGYNKWSRDDIQKHIKERQAEIDKMKERAAGYGVQL